jgi:hypothetical protein
MVCENEKLKFHVRYRSRRLHLAYHRRFRHKGHEGEQSSGSGNCAHVVPEEETKTCPGANCSDEAASGPRPGHHRVVPRTGTLLTAPRTLFGGGLTATIEANPPKKTKRPRASFICPPSLLCSTAPTDRFAPLHPFPTRDGCLLRSRAYLRLFAAYSSTNRPDSVAHALCTTNSHLQPLSAQHFMVSETRRSGPRALQ